jgi:hypothetical protein
VPAKRQRFIAHDRILASPREFSALSDEITSRSHCQETEASMKTLIPRFPIKKIFLPPGKG